MKITNQTLLDDISPIVWIIELFLFLSHSNKDPKTGGFGAWEPPIREQYLHVNYFPRIIMDVLLCTFYLLQMLLKNANL